jgi:hypothetical protein
MPDVPPIEGLSPSWESLLPMLDLAKDLENTTPDLVRSECCDPAASY